MKRGPGLGMLEKLSVIGSLVATLVFGYLLWDNQRVLSYFIPVEEGATVIGSVESSSKDVRRRLRQSLLWYDLHSDQTLYEKDTIFTGDSSETFIRFNDEVGFRMGPNSLVVLSKKDNEFKLDLQLGSLVADVKKGKSIELVGDGENAKITGGALENKVAIKKTDQGKLRLASLNNAFEIEKNGEKIQVDPKKTLRLNPQMQEEASEFPIELMQPPLGHLIWHKPKTDFIFEWDNKTGVKNLDLQVSKDKSFKRVIFSQPVNSGFFAAQGVKTEGQFYWRMVQRNENPKLPSKVVSEPSDFQVAILGPPRMFLPKQKEIIQSDYSDSGPATASVRFVWEDKLGVDRYVFQLAQNKDFSNPLFNEELKDFKKSNVVLPRGKYYWRVRSTSPAQGATTWSPGLREFTIGAPEEIQNLVAEKKKAAEEQIQLGNLVGAPAYRYPDPSALGSKTTEQNVPLRPPMALQEKSQTLLKFDSKLNSREPAAVRKAILNPPTVSWKPVKVANGYEVEISEDITFEKPLVKEKVKGDKFIWKNPKVGQYFWRVRSQRGVDKFSRFSPEFEMNVGLESPVLPKDVSRSFVAKRPEEYIKPGPPVGINWKPVPMADKYKVVVVEDGTENKVIEEVVESSEASLVLPKSGRYTATVAALSKAGEKISPYSEPTGINFEKKYEFGRPKILYPGNGTTVVTFGTGRPDSMILDWQPVSGAKKYRLQFSSDRQFGKVFLEKVTKRDQYFLTDAVPNGVIFWRVRAEHQDLYSTWTKPRFFEIQSVQSSQ